MPNVLQRADIFVLKIIAESFNERPIYFSRTSAGYGNELGLGSYLLTQGLATKVFIPPAVPGRDTLLVPGAGWIDLEAHEDAVGQRLHRPEGAGASGTTGSTVRRSASRTSTSRRG